METPNITVGKFKSEYPPTAGRKIKDNALGVKLHSLLAKAIKGLRKLGPSRSLSESL